MLFKMTSVSKKQGLIHVGVCIRYDYQLFFIPLSPNYEQTFTRNFKRIQSLAGLYVAIFKL